MYTNSRPKHPNTIVLNGLPHSSESTDSGYSVHLPNCQQSTLWFRFFTEVTSNHPRRHSAATARQALLVFNNVRLPTISHWWWYFVSLLGPPFTAFDFEHSIASRITEYHSPQYCFPSFSFHSSQPSIVTCHSIERRDDRERFHQHIKAGHVRVCVCVRRRRWDSHFYRPIQIDDLTTFGKFYQKSNISFLHWLPFRLRRIKKRFIFIIPVRCAR